MTKRQYRSSLWQPESVQNDSVSIELLYSTLQISYKAYNVCRINGFNTLGDLIDYFAEHGTLLDLKGCGLRTQQELVAFMEKLSSERGHAEDKRLPSDVAGREMSVLSRKAAIIEAIDQLDSTEARHLFDWYAHFLSDSYSARTSRILNEVFGQSWINRQAWETILFRADSLTGVGRQTRTEMRDFATEATNYAQLVVSNRQHAVHILLHRFFEVNWDIVQPGQYLSDVQGRINLFNIAMPVLKQSSELGPSRLRALEHLISWDRKREKLTFKNLAAQLQLSVLRTSQIVNELPERIKTSLEPVAHFISNAPQWFPALFLGHEHFKKIDRKMFEAAGLPAESQQSFQFQALIAWGLSERAAVIFPDPLVELSDVYWLLDHETADAVDLEEMCGLIKKLKRTRRKETRQYDLSSLFSWWPDRSVKQQAHLLRLLAEVLDNYLKVSLGEGQWIELEDNSRRNLVQYIEAVLNEHNAPMEVEEVYEAICRQFPDIKVKSSSVRATLARERDIFVRTGGPGVYGLKKWDEFAVRIKSGEVLAGVESLLEYSPMPRHAFDIVRYINLNSTIALEAMMEVLRNDPEDRFRFFPGQFIGLHQKTYPKDRVKFEHLTPETEAMITHYIKDNGPVNKIETVHKLSRKYGLEPIQIEYAIARAEAGGKVSDHNGLLM